MLIREHAVGLDDNVLNALMHGMHDVSHLRVAPSNTTCYCVARDQAIHLLTHERWTRQLRSVYEMYKRVCLAAFNAAKPVSVPDVLSCTRSPRCEKRRALSGIPLNEAAANPLTRLWTIGQGC